MGILAFLAFLPAVPVFHYIVLEILFSLFVGDRGPKSRPPAIPESVPLFYKYNIEITCRREAQTFAGADKNVAYNSCLKDEFVAREQLEQKWKSFWPQDRADCILPGGPGSSYVKLLTCLEMRADAEALSGQRGVRSYRDHGALGQNPPVSDKGAPPGETPPPRRESGPLLKAALLLKRGLPAERELPAKPN